MASEEELTKVRRTGTSRFDDDVRNALVPRATSALSRSPPEGASAGVSVSLGGGGGLSGAISSTDAAAPTTTGGAACVMKRKLPEAAARAKNRTRLPRRGASSVDGGRPRSTRLVTCTELRQSIVLRKACSNR